MESPMNRNETHPSFIFRTMEFWLMLSEKVVVGLRTERIRPESRLIVSHVGALMWPGAICELANPVI